MDLILKPANRLNLNRRGIKRLMALHPSYQLGKWFGISQPTLRRYMAGTEPKAQAVTEYINAEIERLLHAGRDEMAVLKKYINEWANHRVSVDASRPGLDCPFFVLRYAVGEVYSRFEVASNTLYLSRVHLLYWLGETCPDSKQLRERFQARGLFQTTRLNMNEGTGCPAATMDAYQIDLERPDMEGIRTMLMQSAERDDPGQDGKIKERVDIGLTQIQPGLPVLPTGTKPSQPPDA
jgi:hypothetical protein